MKIELKIFQLVITCCFRLTTPASPFRDATSAPVAGADFANSTASGIPDTILDIIIGYGCYCNFLSGEFEKAHGRPADGLDQICKSWHTGYSSVNLNFVCAHDIIFDWFLKSVVLLRETWRRKLSGYGGGLCECDHHSVCRKSVHQFSLFWPVSNRSIEWV